MRDITFRLHALFPMSFFVVFCLFPPFPPPQYYVEKNLFCSRRWWGDWSDSATSPKLYCSLILHNVVT